MFEECKRCLNICDCCARKSCDSCKPFSSQFTPVIGAECKVDTRRVLGYKFKTGDKVRVKKDLIVGKEYDMDYDHNGVCLFTPGMSMFCGKAVTIITAVNGRYHVLEDCNCWYWVDGMFENEVIIDEN